MTTYTAQSKVEYLAQPMARTGQNAKAVEFLTLAGFTLHGIDWIVPLAAELAVSPDEIRNWLTGGAPLTMEDGVWPKVFKALRDRREKLDQLFNEVNSAFRRQTNWLGGAETNPKSANCPSSPCIF